MPRVVLAVDVDPLAVEPEKPVEENTDAHEESAAAPSRPSVSGANESHKPSARTTMSSPVRFDPIWL